MIRIAMRRSLLQRTTLALFALLAGIATLAPLARAGTWTPHGPEGGSVLSLAIHPADPNLVFADTDGTLFRSTDGGGSWAAIVIDGFSPGLGYNRTVISPADPNDIYAASKRSVDGGTTWTSTDAINVAVDPTDPEILYVNDSYSPGITRIDHGVATELTLPSSPRFSVVAQSAPTTIYVATRNPTTGVYRSTNSGATWTYAATGLTAPLVNDLIIAPTDALTVYASDVATLEP